MEPQLINEVLHAYLGFLYWVLIFQAITWGIFILIIWSAKISLIKMQRDLYKARIKKAKYRHRTQSNK